MRWLEDPEIIERIDRLDLQFGRAGTDPFGISKKHLVWFYSAMKWFYRSYFRVSVHGMEHIPAQGRGMLVGNHSGGLPVDGGMLLTSLILDHDPPRHAHGMVERFANRWPVVNQWFSRIGQFTGLPEHAIRMLEEDRLLMVFPEGVRGTGKLYSEKYRLQRFGTGFVRLALRTGTPIYPLAFIGGEEALKTMYRSELLAKLTGAPYWPVPPHLIPIPLPEQCALHFGPPLQLEGTGREADEVINGYVEQVKDAIRALIAEGLRARGKLAPVDTLRAGSAGGEGASS